MWQILCTRQALDKSLVLGVFQKSGVNLVLKEMLNFFRFFTVLLHVSRYFKQKNQFFFSRLIVSVVTSRYLAKNAHEPAPYYPQVKSLLGALFSKLPSTWVQELEQLENYLLNDRGIRTAISDPEVTSAIQDVASNPLTVVKCFSNPKVASVIKIELERIRRYLYHRRVAPQTWVSQAQRVRTR